MACGFWFNFGGQTCCDINRDTDGTCTLPLAPSTWAARAPSASWPRKNPASGENVRVVIADTSSLGHNDMTDGSRGTFSTGLATIAAAPQRHQGAVRPRCKDVGHSEDAVIWEMATPSPPH
jgi:hypothetical protein